MSDQYKYVFDRESEDRGLFISIDGFDGSGKSTQVEALARRFEVKGHHVVRTRQPTDWYRELAIVQSFHAGGGTPERAKILALLAAADRQKHVQEVVRPALQEGKVVITDRYVCSTFAVFCHRGVDLDFLVQINRTVPKPTCAFFLDVPQSVLVARLHARDGSALKYEEQADDRITSILAQWFEMRDVVEYVDGTMSHGSVTDALWSRVPYKWQGAVTNERRG